CQRRSHPVVIQSSPAAIGDFPQAEQPQKGGRLAGAVGTKQPEPLPPRHRKRTPFDDGSAVIALGETLRLNDILIHLRRSHRLPNQATAPTRTRSAIPISTTPTSTPEVEVTTAIRKFCDADSPRADARNVVW